MEIYRPHKATQEEMTKFHSDDYIRYLSFHICKTSTKLIFGHNQKQKLWEFSQKGKQILGIHNSCLL